MNILDIYPDITKAPVEIRMSRAKANDTPPEILKQLSKDSFWFVRDLTASNINTPTDCLVNLCNDPDFRIRDDAKKTLKKIEQTITKPTLDSLITAAAEKSSPQTCSDAVEYEATR